jgi:hypothetical protein
MRLMSIEQVRQGLDTEFRPLEPTVTGLRLISRVTPPDALRQVQERLNVEFPEAFRRVISQFDLGDLAIGPVSFCGSGNYLAELVELNEQVRWWGLGGRPAERLMVANSDPYAILLNVTNGRVIAFDREGDWLQGTDIAEDFELFVRGIGSVMLLRAQVLDKESLGREVASQVGAQDKEFWEFLAR